VPVTLHNVAIKEKTKKTWIEKYGVDIPTKSEKIIQQIKETNIKRYGNVCPTKNKKVLFKSQ